MMFQDEAIHFARTAGDQTAPRKPAAGGGGDQNRLVRAQYPRWNLDGGSSSDASEDGVDEEDDEDDVNDDDDDLEEGDGLISLDENNNVKNGNNSSGSEHSSSVKVNGLSIGMMVKDGNLSEQQRQNEKAGNYDSAITIVQPDLYCPQIMNGGDCSGSVQKEVRGENAYGFCVRKEVMLLVDPGESLRTHLLDPVTGDLMDDAMILSCGHSFGSGGMQYVFRMKACCKCSRPISEDLVRPNLAMRSAVQAFRREDDSHSSKVPKRKRERYEQEKCSYDDPYLMESRVKGVQFPFTVSDRVIIKGNKRTPQRFVGRVAVVTTQCLNGWYVVKTLDNAESVKLQYRSLAKASDDASPSNPIQNKTIVPNWL